jgi:hypothetical protein
MHAACPVCERTQQVSNLLCCTQALVDRALDLEVVPGVGPINSNLTLLIKL